MFRGWGISGEELLCAAPAMPTFTEGVQPQNSLKPSGGWRLHRGFLNKNAWVCSATNVTDPQQDFFLPLLALFRGRALTSSPFLSFPGVNGSYVGFQVVCPDGYLKPFLALSTGRDAFLAACNCQSLDVQDPRTVRQVASPSYVWTA
jgi:hypothetical protein